MLKIIYLSQIKEFLKKVDLIESLEEVVVNNEI